MSDNLKVLDMIHTYFGKICGTEEKTQQERATQYQEERKKWEGYLTWYAGNRGKKTGENAVTLQNIYAPMVYPKIIITTDKNGVEQQTVDKSIEIPEDVMAIFQDWNMRGVDDFHARDMVEGFLFNVREGWGASLKKHIESFG